MFKLQRDLHKISSKHESKYVYLKYIYNLVSKKVKMLHKIWIEWFFDKKKTYLIEDSTIDIMPNVENKTFPFVWKIYHRLEFDYSKTF